jgi:ATP adenylyltransferase
MDYIFSPWRYRYLAEPRSDAECLLCRKLAEKNDEANLIVFRGTENAVLLNLYPYTSGHMMILPYRHLASLGECPPDCRHEMIELAARAEMILNREYQPDGINVGLNLGEAAGAGIAGHIHMHVVPRWYADSNFMTTISETRVLPEELSQTYKRLRPHFAKQ